MNNHWDLLSNVCPAATPSLKKKFVGSFFFQNETAIIYIFTCSKHELVES